MAVDSDDDRRRLRREEDERERNRREVMERKRQWEVVDSDNDDRKPESPRRRGDARSNSRSRSADDLRDRHWRDRRKKHKRRARRGSASASSSRSSSRERSRHKKDRKKHRSRSKHRKKRGHKRHKESKKHKQKSHRCAEHDESDSYASSSLSETEREILAKSKRQSNHGAASGGGAGAAVFGKYGIINPSDLHSNAKVKSSFERWLSEIKGIADFNGPKHELMEFFKEYAEDYNTATLPHLKFYNYDKWEMEEYARKKREAEEAAAAKGGGGDVALDEIRHKEKMAERAKQRHLEEMKVVQYGMTAEKREEMKHQARLRHEMNVAYKTGDEEMRKRLQKRLEPEEIAKR